jgi:hypothetical protein
MPFSAPRCRSFAFASTTSSTPFSSSTAIASSAAFFCVVVTVASRLEAVRARSSLTRKGSAWVMALA